MRNSEFESKSPRCAVITGAPLLRPEELDFTLGIPENHTTLPNFRNNLDYEITANKSL